jgi:RND family efflux transporter MFP subunit
MRKGWLIGAAVVLVMAGGGATWWSKRSPSGAGTAQAAKPPTPAASVPLEFRPNEVAQPVRVTLPQSVEFSGPLVAPNTAILRAKTAGTLLSLNVAEGSRVTAGQVLGRIDQAELGSRIAERDANVESARASLVQAERTHASNERLAAQNFISPIALENSRAALDTARAALNAAKATLDTTRVAQRDASLVAPIAGIVAKRHVLPGEKVANEQQVLTLVDLRTLELAGSVGTHEVGRLLTGMAVKVKVEGMAEELTGKLVRIAPAAEAGTRSIGVTVALANGQERLRAGQYAVAKVDINDAQQRLVVPLASVGSTSGQPYVWLLDKDHLVRRAVTLGRRDEAGGRVEVLEGVTPESRLLAARFDNLRDGAPAKLVAANAPAAAASAAPLPASASSR